MTESLDAKRDSLLQAALPHIAFDGWDEAVLAKAAEELGWDRREAKRLFPEGPLQAIIHFSHSADLALAETLKEDYALSEMKIRERIATAVMVRLRANMEYREAIRRAFGILMLPWNSGASLKALYNTVDVIWRAAGDTSTDYNFYTKRMLLAKVYSSTVYVWLNDDSPNLEETEAFLHRRISDVMQIQKWKAKLKDPLSFLNELNPAFKNTQKG